VIDGVKSDHGADDAAFVCCPYVTFADWPVLMCSVLGNSVCRDQANGRLIGSRRNYNNAVVEG